MNKKEIIKLAELNAKAKENIHLTSDEIKLWNELEFKRNKENIHFRLSDYDKYYYAYQCWDFTQHILKNGFNQYKPSDIKSLYFDNHNITIRLHSTAETDIKRFNNKQELLGYVVGFNDSQSQKVA